MTGQVDAGALDPFLSSPHVVSCSAVVSCTAELCIVLGQDGLRYRLRAPCNTEHSVFVGQYSNQQTTYHPATELVSRHTSHTVHEETGTTSNTSLSETSRIQFVGKYIAYLADKLLHVMDDYVVFHVQIEVLLANGIDLHLYGICDNVQANRDIWHTSQQRDKRVGFQFPLVIISALAPQSMCKQRSSSDAKASLQMAAFPTDRDRLAVTSAGCCVTVTLSNIGMLCDHIDKKLRDHLTQQFLHHSTHLKHQVTSKRLRTSNLVSKFAASLFQSGRPFCVTNPCSHKTTFVFSLRCKASAGLTAPVHDKMCWFLASLMQSQDGEKPQD